MRLSDYKVYFHKHLLVEKERVKTLPPDEIVRDVCDLIRYFVLIVDGNIMSQEFFSDLLFSTCREQNNMNEERAISLISDIEKKLV